MASRFGSIPDFEFGGLWFGSVFMGMKVIKAAESLYGRGFDIHISIGKALGGVVAQQL